MQEELLEKIGRKGQRKNNIDRRTFLKSNFLSLTSVAIGGSWSFYSCEVEPASISLEHVEVSLSRLPPEFDGFLIAQISDIHFGQYIDAGFVEKAVGLIEKQNPDIVVLTGDYVFRSADYAEPCAQVLQKLKPKFGTYAVLGNHEYTTDPDEAKRALHRHNIQVLQNAALPLRRDGATVWLAGIDDALMLRDDIHRTLHKVPPEQATIVLVHEPDFADIVCQYPVDLQLSGHSHGGQVCLPFLGPPFLPPLGEKYPRGMRKVRDLTLYTNRGLGLITPAVRFNCPPEITFLTLRASQSPQYS